MERQRAWLLWLEAQRAGVKITRHTCLLASANDDVIWSMNRNTEQQFKRKLETDRDGSRYVGLRT